MLVHITIAGQEMAELSEFRELALSSGADIIEVVTGTCAHIQPKFFIGQGKVSEIKNKVQVENIDIVLFNHDLSPAQERNLEREIKARVLSRSGLILDIFASRARSFEGKLQVELAQLEHLSTRLIRGWTHLERQKGGIGLRGPGETQLETDRRLLAHRIKHIQGKLKKVEKQRAQNRQSRKKSNLPLVSIVGYTNAGKSSLFNALTKSEIYAEDRLFATLDTTMRRFDIDGLGAIVLADTVGFIKALPHALIDAFHATLEETHQADLLLHVIDLSNPNWREAEEAVNTVLDEIDANHIPCLKVFNKIDKLENLPSAKKALANQRKSVWVSAKEKTNLEDLKDAIAIKLYGDFVHFSRKIEPHEGELRARLYKLNAVLKECYDATGELWLTLKLSPQQLPQFLLSQ